MTEHYAPFPETALIALAQHNENLARAWSDKGAGTRYKEEHLKQARICRDAVESHNALRERCLMAEHQLAGEEAMRNAQAATDGRSE